MQVKLFSEELEINCLTALDNRAIVELIIKKGRFID